MVVYEIKMRKEGWDELEEKLTILRNSIQLDDVVIKKVKDWAVLEIYCDGVKADTIKIKRAGNKVEMTINEEITIITDEVEWSTDFIRMAVEIIKRAGMRLLR